MDESRLEKLPGIAGFSGSSPERSGRFDLYLDESGTFTETEPGSPAAALGPSQLVGLLVPKGALTPASARAALSSACDAAGLPLGEEVHGMSVPRGAPFDAIVSRLAEIAEENRWQPVRLVNREAVGYGDRATNYVNLVAELVLRIFEEVGRGNAGRISIHLVCASVKLGRNPDDTPRFLEKEEYLRRLRESVAFTAVRRGDAVSAPSWNVEDVTIRSGRKRRELQLCDILSNASYDEYRKCGPAAEHALRAAFGRFDLSLVRHDLCRRIDELIEQYSPATALITIAERMSEEDGGGAAREPLEERLATVLRQVASMSTASRDAHLLQVVAWTQQLIVAQRAGDAGYRFAKWFLAILESIVREMLPEEQRPSLDWFAFAMHRLALAASNRRGALADARSESAAIDRLLPKLASQWEHADEMMDGMVTQAAHYVESFHFFLAVDRMRAVDSFYESMSGLFAAALPGVFPGRVRSLVRGKALGTLVQAEMFASLREPGRLSEARIASDRAIAEFPSPSDRKRQFLYRTQLETASGDHAGALAFLSRSLGLPDDASHGDVASAIRRLDVPDQGFPLLHWLRLGSSALLSRDAASAKPFLEALSDSRLIRSPWISGGAPMEYPAHGVRRQAAVLLAAQGLSGDAVTLLRGLARLGHVEEARMGPSLVQMAAFVEVAGLSWTSDPAMSRMLLDSPEPSLPGVLQTMEALEKNRPDEFGIVRHVLASWPDAISSALSETPPKPETGRILFSLGRPIGR